MMKALVFGVFLGFCVSGVSAQMPDMLGGLAIQGALTQQSAKSVAQGMNQMAYTQLLQQMNLLIMEIQTSYMNGYQGLSKTAVQTQLPPQVMWDVMPSREGGFQIVLKQVEQATCRRLARNPVGATKILINNQTTHQCAEKNELLFLLK